MPATGKRYFDASTLFLLGLAALLLVSLPGGCGDSESDDEAEDSDIEAVAEPTSPPMMEIVDPEPGDLDDVPPPGEEAEDDATPPEETEEVNGEQEGESVENEGVYVVQPGDTLYGIAVQLSVSMDALMAANDMEDPNSLQVGQELQIPD